MRAGMDCSSRQVRPCRVSKCHLCCRSRLLFTYMMPSAKQTCTGSSSNSSSLPCPRPTAYSQARPALFGYEPDPLCETVSVRWVSPVQATHMVYWLLACMLHWPMQLHRSILPLSYAPCTSGMAWSPAGLRMHAPQHATTSDGRWDLPAGQCVWALTAQHTAHSLAVLPSSRCYALVPPTEGPCHTVHGRAAVGTRAGNKGGIQPGTMHDA